MTAWRKEGLRIGFVPTMGALHVGHLSLVKIALEHADRVVVSIFVNPTQFAPHEDFDDYPRCEADDIKKLAEIGTHLVYTPTALEMYPEGFATAIKVGGPSAGLCGGARPHFFDGVSIVVTKLLMQVSPDVAVFGEKDYQQLLVIRRMTADLDIPTTILSGATAREADGLAISSRNQYLSTQERPIAAQLQKTLQETAASLSCGVPSAKALTDGIQALQAAGFRKIDYLELRDAKTLTPLDALETSGRLLVAAWLGKTRLIDNIAVEPN